MAESARLPHVVIIGGGFGGLYCARRAADYPVRVTVVDRKNHHTFQPLLYQVATAVLSPGDIAAPLRGILHTHANVEVLLDEAVGFDLEHRTVLLRHGEMPYDYLVVAAGATHSYFGHDDWAALAPGLKTIEDALEIRRRVLLAFELAERRAAKGEPPQPIHLVVIGGGPTGVELAGALAEIARHALAHDFRAIDPADARVLLLEAGPRILASYPDDLSRSAQRQLTALGVEVRTGALVTAIAPGQVTVGNETIPAAVTLWAAGVAASPLGRMLGAATDKAGRVLVEPDLSIPGHPEVFVIGDLAAVARGDHLDRSDSGIEPGRAARVHANPRLVPGVAPAAIQMGEVTADNIWRSVQRQERRPFRYRDKGSLATIGRAAAVAQFGKLHIEGAPAWLMWLFVHIFFLIGFRNRLAVMLQWAWAYVTHQRPTRLITGSEELPGADDGG